MDSSYDSIGINVPESGWTPKRRSPSMGNHTLVAVDLAKSVFEVAVSHYPGQVAKQRRYTRKQFPLALAQLPPSTIVMEACGSAHFWARRSQSLGHQPVLLPPHAVRPYVRRNKTDRTDTKGMLEAYRNEDIRPVPVKSVAQQTLASAASASFGMARRAHGPHQHFAWAAT
jgi:transposase